MTFKQKVGSPAMVWHGTAEMTKGGLRKKDLVMKDGRIHSKSKVKMGQSPALQKWRNAVEKARKELKVEGFVALSKGTKLYKLAKKYHNKM